MTIAVDLGRKATKQTKTKRTVVSMATDSSHRVVKGENLVTTLAPSFFICSSLFLQVTRTTIKSRMGSKFGRIRSGTYELAALERLEKSP